VGGTAVPVAPPFATGVTAATATIAANTALTTVVTTAVGGIAIVDRLSFLYRLDTPRKHHIVMAF